MVFISFSLRFHDILADTQAQWPVQTGFVHLLLCGESWSCEFVRIDHWESSDSSDQVGANSPRQIFARCCRGFQAWYGASDGQRKVGSSVLADFAVFVRQIEAESLVG